MCGCLLCTPYWGPGLATQACALTRNRIDNPLVCRLVLNPLSHTSQGSAFVFNSGCFFGGSLSQVTFLVYDNIVSLFLFFSKV